jgi:hypothetical protein
MVLLMSICFFKKEIIINGKEEDVFSYLCSYLSSPENKYHKYEFNVINYSKKVFIFGPPMLGTTRMSIVGIVAGNGNTKLSIQLRYWWFYLLFWTTLCIITFSGIGILLAVLGDILLIIDYCYELKIYTTIIRDIVKYFGVK